MEIRTFDRTGWPTSWSATATQLALRPVSLPTGIRPDEWAGRVGGLVRKSDSSGRQGRVATAPARSGNSWGGLCAVSAAATLMVFGVIAAVIAIRSSPFDPTGPAPVRTEPVDGVIALRPDLLSKARWPFPASGAFTSIGESSGPADVEDRPEQADAVSPTAGSAIAEIQLVHEFYDRLGTDPAHATDLVSHRLLGVDRSRVEQAWEEVDSVRVLGVEASPPDRTRVDTLTTYPDGSTLKLHQLLTIDTRVCPRIVDIDLLTARYSPP